MKGGGIVGCQYQHDSMSHVDSLFDMEEVFDRRFVCTLIECPNRCEESTVKMCIRQGVGCHVIAARFNDALRHRNTLASTKSSYYKTRDEMSLFMP